MGLATTSTTGIWSSAAYKTGWKPKATDVLMRQAAILFAHLQRGPVGAYHAIEEVLGPHRTLEVYRGQASLPPASGAQAQPLSKRKQPPASDSGDEGEDDWGQLNHGANRRRHD